MRRFLLYFQRVPISHAGTSLSWIFAIAMIQGGAVVSAKELGFDLALDKSIVSAKTPSFAPFGDTAPFYASGDLLELRLVITNQGAEAAKNIVVTEYLQSGFELVSEDWSELEGRATIGLPNLLMPGQRHEFSLVLRVRDSEVGLLRSAAEISYAETFMGKSAVDSDSVYDANFGNDRCPICLTENGLEDDCAFVTIETDSREVQPLAGLPIESVASVVVRSVEPAGATLEATRVDTPVITNRSFTRLSVFRLPPPAEQPPTAPALEEQTSVESEHKTLAIVP